jgi:hypothetical protein
MNVFTLIKKQNIKALIDYIKNPKNEIWNEIEDNDYNGK